MSIEQITEGVRYVSTGRALSEAYDLRIEVLSNGEWVHHTGWNSMSNDWAFTEAQRWISAFKAGRILIAKAGYEVTP